MKHIAVILIVIFYIKINKSCLISEKRDKVNKNVKLFFTPSLYEAYRYNLGDLHKINENPKFLKHQPTAIYIHGFQDSGERDGSVMAIRSAYRIRNDHNFISVDWKYYSKCFLYDNSVIPQLKIICETIAENLLSFFMSGYDISKIHLVGHSLGGQCIGLVGRHLKKISNNSYVIPRLYALDPAGPGFEKQNTLTKFLKWVTFKKVEFPMISRDDANYVQVIHTNGGKYGTVESRGHVDFYPNDGSDQAGCDLETFDDICSHSRAWYYYQESVVNDGTFLAIKCNSFNDFTRNNCQKSEIAVMGLSNDTTSKGKFFLVTHPNPLQTSLGKEGINYRQLKLFTENDVEGDSELKVMMSPTRNYDFKMDQGFQVERNIKEICKNYHSGSTQLTFFISLIFINFCLIFI